VRRDDPPPARQRRRDEHITRSLACMMWRIRTHSDAP
jgi:hypothetical protein